MTVIKTLKPNIFFLILLVLVFCLPMLSFKYYKHSQDNAVNAKLSSIKPVPFTIYATEKITDSQGNTSVSQKYTFAQRSDGAFMEQREEMFRAVHTQSREVYFTDGLKAQIEDHVRAISTCYLGDTEKHMLWFGRPDPSVGCVKSYLDGATQNQNATLNDRSFFGIGTTKIVQEGPSRRLTVWRAPSLSCQVLMRIAEFRDNGKAEYSNPSVLVVDRVDNGEPNTSLFDLPQTYDDVAPSELVARSLAVNGQSMSQLQRDMYSKVDARYYKQKANKKSN